VNTDGTKKFFLKDRFHREHYRLSPTNELAGTAALANSSLTSVKKSEESYLQREALSSITS